MGAARLPRLLRLIQALQSGRLCNSVQLAEECGVSRRTIFRDISILQEAGIHVLYDEERQGYCMPLRLTIPASQLSLSEAISLLLFCSELSDSTTGIPFQQDARQAAMKILEGLPRSVRETVAEITESMSIRIDSRNQLIGSQSLYEVLLSALIRREQIRVRYHSLTEASPLSTLLSPYRLLFSRRSWYVIGRSSWHRTVRTFNVGRLEQLELAGTFYKIPPRFSLDRYLGNAWHLIRGTPTGQIVKVQFDKQVAMNVAEVRWHKTQTAEWLEDGSVVLSFKVDGLSEIVWWILGYGRYARVLEPVTLKAMIHEHAQQMLAT